MRKKLNISINDDLTAFFNSLITSGRYSCIDEIVRTSLEDFREKEKAISEIIALVRDGEASGYKNVSIKESLGFFEGRRVFSRYSALAIQDIRYIFNILGEEFCLSYAEKFISDLEGYIELFSERPGSSLDCVLPGLKRYTYRDMHFYYKIRMNYVSVIRVLRDDPDHNQL